MRGGIHLKKIKIITLITLLCFIFTIPASAAVNWDKEPKNYDVKVYINSKDNEVHFPADMGRPFIAKGRTFVPYRIMCEALGVQVAWDGTARKVTAMGNNSKVELFIGKQNYKVNGVNKRMEDAEPFILAGRTYIPVRYLTEGLDYKVNYDQDGRILYICSFTKGQSEAEQKAILREIVEANQPGTQNPDESERLVVKDGKLSDAQVTRIKSMSKNVPVTVEWLQPANVKYHNEFVRLIKEQLGPNVIIDNRLICLTGGSTLEYYAVTPDGRLHRARAMDTIDRGPLVGIDDVTGLLKFYK